MVLLLEIDGGREACVRPNDSGDQRPAKPVRFIAGLAEQLVQTGYMGDSSYRQHG